MGMKNILCYGDSNTFGLEAETLERYSETQRWSGILSSLLKNEYNVIEDGLCDRNAFLKNEKGSEYCAQENLSPCLNNYSNINIIILALGTNDLQFAYNFDEKVLKTGLLNLINIIKNYNTNTKIIIIPPVKLNNDVISGYFDYQFNEISVMRSDKTFYLYKEMAQQNNCYYFDFNEIAEPSSKDGLHYDPNSHKLIAENLAKYINLEFQK